MTTFVDRRKSDRKTQTGNRIKFLNRSRASIRKALRKNIGDADRSIRDIGKGGSVRIPTKGIAEPTFRNGKGGRTDTAIAGNKSFRRGDQIDRPDEGGGSGGGGPGDPNAMDSLDEFEFTLTREEFLNFFFEDLELPNMVKTALKDITQEKWCRHGFTNVGIPANLDVSRSYIQSLSRRIALRGVYEKKIRDLRRLEPVDVDAITGLEKKRDTLPFMDDLDLKYRLFVQQPQPVTKACMIAMMDVSGSMGEYEKDLAKRFFMLLYLFLERKYEQVDVVFIRHTTEAREVDEQEFFYSQESGGTVVSSALLEAARIIQTRYNSSEWNIYLSQCSDGDNTVDDNQKCDSIIHELLLPYIQYFAYVQVGHNYDESANMWGVFMRDKAWDLYAAYEKIAQGEPRFQVRKLDQPKDIWPVFRDLFRKDIPL